jgi:integrase
MDANGGTMQVRRGLQRIDGKLRVMATKTPRSCRTIPLPGPMLDRLREHLSQQERERLQLAERWPAPGFVFTTPIGTPIDPDNFSKAVRAALTKAGVCVVRMHDLLGVPPRTVMEMAGHSALEMTINVYGHVTLDDKREALDKLGDLFEEDGK